MPIPRLIYLHNIDISTHKANLVQVVSMCSAWYAAGYDTTLVLRSSGLDEAAGTSLLRSQYGLDEGIKLRLIRLRLPLRLGRYLSPFAIRCILKEESPDFCFVRDPLFFWQVIKTGTRAFMELHNNRMHHGKPLIDRWMRHLVLTGSRQSATLCLIAISDALKVWWQKAGVPENKIVALHDGFSRTMFSHPVPKEAARQQTGLPSDRRIVLYTGNLQANRGIDYILRLAARNPELLFVLAGGTDEQKGYYEEFCRDSRIENTLFTGHIPHPAIPMYLYSADVLLAMWSGDVPTINYCSPLKVFEYMATGIPAVYPGYPTIREVIQDGVNGFLSEPDNEESFKQTLHRALALTGQEAETYAAKARQTAFAHYAWDARIEKIKELLPEHLRTA